MTRLLTVNRGYIGCEFGWTKYNGSCYKRFTSPRDWNGARDSCKQHGAALLRIEAQWTQDFVERFLRVKHANIDRIWIGMKSFDLNRPKFFPYRLFLNLVIVRLKDQEYI